MTRSAKLLACIAVVALLATPLPALAALATAMQACSHCASSTAMPECCIGAAVPVPAALVSSPVQLWAPQVQIGVTTSHLTGPTNDLAAIAGAHEGASPPTCAGLCTFRN